MHNTCGHHVGTEVPMQHSALLKAYSVHKVLPDTILVTINIFTGNSRNILNIFLVSTMKRSYGLKWDATNIFLFCLVEERKKKGELK